MKILFLAPQPFFQERGTPIAVRLAIQVLAQRGKQDDGREGLKDEIDLLTYHEGEKVEIPGMTLWRIWAPAFIKNVGPGISFKKLICDFIFLFTALSLVARAKGKRYDLVHAVEESVFVAMLIKLIWGIPYIYDMDSSLALQLTEKWWFLRPLYPALSFFERHAIKNAMAVVPVCDALAVLAQDHGSKDTQILRDISLIDTPNVARIGPNLLKQEIGVASSSSVVLYIGNLEPYQGVDLLIDSFAKIKDEVLDSHLVIIGGSDQHIAQAKARVASLNANSRIHLVGRKPLTKLGEYLSFGDILASPRVRGNNTPMKIYSYLHSGIPIIATELPTHTQVLTQEVAVLCKPTVKEFSVGLLALLRDRALQQRIGTNAKNLAEERYTLKVFAQGLNELYDRVDQRITPLRAVNT